MARELPLPVGDHRLVFAAGSCLANLSTTLETSFCVEALHEALARYGCPEIFNTDQGSQFTSKEFTDVVLDHGIKISMDGKGRFIDNIFVERLWRSLKYEEVYLDAYDNVQVARLGYRQRYFDFFNDQRGVTSALGYQATMRVSTMGFSTRSPDTMTFNAMSQWWTRMAWYPIRLTFRETPFGRLRTILRRSTTEFLTGQAPPSPYPFLSSSKWGPPHTHHVPVRRASNTSWSAIGGKDHPAEWVALRLRLKFLGRMNPLTV